MLFDIFLMFYISYCKWVKGPIIYRWHELKADHLISTIAKLDE